MTTSEKQHHDRGATVKVLYCFKRNAKKLKVALDKDGFLNKDFRMTGVDVSSAVGTTKGEGDEACFTEMIEIPSGSEIDKDMLVQQCIAIPVMDEFFAVSTMSSLSDKKGIEDLIVAQGIQLCPYSSAMLGNNRHVVSAASQTCCTSPNKNNNENKTKHSQQMTRVQLGLLSTLTTFLKDSSFAVTNEQLTKGIQNLSISVCPKKLEMIGDDNTLVIPRKAFVMTDSSFASLIHLVVVGTKNEEDAKSNDNDTYHEIYHELWKQFAHIYASPRVVRRGDIDPESSIRESGHRLLWPKNSAVTSSSIDGISTETGDGSPGWITVTEQGIKQSFDLTRVMFSRGNITEKIRFGQKVVQEGEVVLDMYAGIGYYTLPALIHGKASHVYACEWNEHAAFALRYNLKANGVDDKATVLVGDCRVVAREANLINMFDRISLGLLPSCEGGWATAVKALRDVSGGWLHIHANVPEREKELWQFWLCKSLLSLVQQNQSRQDWVILCTHVERVKSFAPMINHYVADVFVGPPILRPTKVDMNGSQAGIIIHKGEFRPCPQHVEPPSCALSSDGKLNQKWMMNES